MKILEDTEVSSFIIAIQQFLIDKAMFEKTKPDKFNITTLGGVGFYFEYDDNETYLCYTKHPKDWNESSIKYDMEEYTKYMLAQKGVYIEQ